jgi:hypothetical protein
MIETLTNTFHHTNQQHPGDDNEIIIMPSLATPTRCKPNRETVLGSGLAPGNTINPKKKTTAFAHVYHLWWWWMTLTITETATGT